MQNDGKQIITQMMNAKLQCEALDGEFQIVARVLTK